jgi:hypothetical protein
VATSSSIENLETENPELAPEVLRGIARFGLFEPVGPELALELGLSIWMRRNGADLGSLRSSMLAMRDALVQTGHLDPATEPIPLLGHSDRTDVLNLASYLCSLVKRAASSAGLEPEDISERAIGRLSGHAGFRHATGAGVIRIV